MYNLIKYELIKETSRNLNEYFDSTSISTLCNIEGMGSCKTQLTGFWVKPLYQKLYSFFKLEITPSHTKTKKIQFVVTKEDIQRLVGIEAQGRVSNDQLLEILQNLSNKFLYMKDTLYYSLVVKCPDSYGYNKFSLCEEEYSDETSFLKTRLKSVIIFKQKTIRVQLKSTRTFCILTVQKLEGIESLKIVICVPSTNRRFELLLPENNLDDHEEHVGAPNWDQILNNIAFSTTRYGALVASIGDYSSLVTECHFTSFGKVHDYVHYLCFKVFKKNCSNQNNFLSQF